MLYISALKKTKELPHQYIVVRARASVSKGHRSLTVKTEYCPLDIWLYYVVVRMFYRIPSST